jgi:CubicO group peptidase (beta-lactamase class C family)
VDDRWHLGSCTKAMTATLAARFIERGTLGWHTRIGETLTGKIDPGYRDVTLEQLLAHRAGAPGVLERRPIWSWLWSHEGPIAEERAKLVATLLAEPPEAKPGSEFLYSNAGYVIAGAMLEAKAGGSWETLVARELFQPLGMTSAGFGAPGAASEPWGHRVEDDRVTPIEPGPRADNPPALGPAGTVHASLRDWAKFVALHLAGARGGSDFLESGTFQKLHTPPAGADYALGWIVVERDWAGGRALTHLGSNTAWVAVTWLAPQRDFAVLVATNQGGSRAEKAADRAAWALIQQQLGAGGRPGG